jgi:hypothetical protein
MAYAANAGQTSAWTTLGSNDNSTFDLDVAGFTDNIRVVNGTPAQARHECHMWIDYTDGIYTKPFDWVINGDFTVVMNAAYQDFAADPGDVDVDIEGSVTGNDGEWFKLADLGTWNAGTTTGTSTVAYVYDYDTKGRAPYMRIAADAGTDSDNRHKPIKIVVIAH